MLLLADEFIFLVFWKLAIKSFKLDEFIQNFFVYYTHILMYTNFFLFFGAEYSVERAVVYEA